MTTRIAVSTAWLVYTSDCRYEGGGVEAVFSTRRKAEAYALARVDQEREIAALNHRSYQRDYPEHHHDDPPAWQLEDVLTWGDGMQIIRVYSVEVDDPKPLILHARNVASSRAYEAEQDAKPAIGVTP